ncbi:MAG TPA: L,D-transpeptidase family protein [Chryseolinea sp.]|nr:L,D-transpeptidase family protein [Chryseolinea sp.]HPH47400.1 L,D-transpeptidase family protein [Chryseolinea sp.]HPM32321.1 L,D-transpeptidase family protein [Chryseolinea sp.]
MRYLIFIGLIMFFQDTSFKDAQLKNSRVKIAYQEKESVVKNYFKTKNLNYTGFHLFIHAFKKEEQLEVWIKEKGKEEYALLQSYPFCASSGTLGPKRKEGDLQIPEGIYYLNHFNPVSNFYLSLGVNYPNATDKILSDKNHPGGNIYIHGNCVTIGCIPLTDDKIKEVYLLAVEARNNRQEKIPVHIFPDRLDEGSIEKLESQYAPSKTTVEFWKNLQPIYQDFKASQKLKVVKVNSKGEYHQ